MWIRPPDGGRSDAYIQMWSWERRETAIYGTSAGQLHITGDFTLNLYKHGITRTYLNLDDQGNCYVYCSDRRYEPADFSVELEKLEIFLKQQGETLESVYDDEYIARKTEALQKAGIPLLRFKVEPEEVKVH